MCLIIYETNFIEVISISLAAYYLQMQLTQTNISIN